MVSEQMGKLVHLRGCRSRGLMFETAASIGGRIPGRAVGI